MSGSLFLKILLTSNDFFPGSFIPLQYLTSVIHHLDTATTFWLISSAEVYHRYFQLSSYPSSFSSLLQSLSLLKIPHWSQPVLRSPSSFTWPWSAFLIPSQFGWTQLLHVPACHLLCASSVAQSCPTLCDPVDCSPPGSSVHGITQARILEWAAISCSRESFWPRDQTHISCISCTGRQILYHCVA